MVPTERRKLSDSIDLPIKAESKQTSQNCHSFNTGKTYIVLELQAKVGEVSVRSARAKKQREKGKNKIGMDRNENRKRDLSFAETSTPKRNEVKNARRQLDRMMDDEETQQTPPPNQAGLNQALFQDVSSHLSRNGGDETSDTQSLGVSFAGSQTGEPEQGAIASAIVERIDQLAKNTQNGFGQVAKSIEDLKTICDTQRDELKSNIIAWLDTVGAKVENNTKRMNAMETKQVDINVAIINHHKEKERLANSIFIAGAESQEKALQVLKTITDSEDIHKKFTS